MDRFALLIVWSGFGAVLLALMVVGWLMLRRRQRAVATPAGRPEQLGDVLATVAGRYVATTVAGQPLQRIAVHGLGFRGDATVVVTTLGILLVLVGRDVWIPAESIVGHGRATWTIDRVVERDGLTTIGWRLGAQEVESALRLPDPTAFETAVDRLLAGRSVT